MPFYFCQAGQCTALSSHGSGSEIWYFSFVVTHVVVAAVYKMKLSKNSF